MQDFHNAITNYFDTRLRMTKICIKHFSIVAIYLKHSWGSILIMYISYNSDIGSIRLFKCEHLNFSMGVHLVREKSPVIPLCY